jgi:tetratricopeptide (TPR) repeat protein
MHLGLRNLTLFVITLCVTAVVRPQALTLRIDNVPMYGQPQILGSEELKIQDKRFITEAVAGLGSREVASNVWWKQGEEFLSQRNLDMAMRRYNQAWLLNPNSFKPYWGFARILLEGDKLVDAIAQFDRAVALVDDRREEPALLTDAASARTYLAKNQMSADERRVVFSEAAALYKRAIQADPDYGNAYKRYAMCLYSQGDYETAWSMVREARKRQGVIIPPSFLEALRKAIPEPPN